MKTLKHIFLIISGVLVLNSCSEYLEKTPDADVTDEDVFGTFQSFQGFVEQMYYHIFDYGYQGLNTTPNIGGESHSTFWANTAYHGNYGLYIAWHREEGRNVNQTFVANRGAKPTGIWTGSWLGIRMANVVLEKLPLLVNATQEERDLIAGQAYFFRAWFYWEIIKAFGGMPYIDRVLSPNEDLTFPRLTYQATTDKMVEDFDRAAALLPDNWDNTTVGSAFPGSNTGRATKGAALAFKAKALLFAGSPLMNKYSGKTYEYDLDYMEKAAAAAWEMIQFSEGVYSLVPWANYKDNFAKNDGTYPWTTETIWMKMDWTTGSRGQGMFDTKFGRTYSPARFAGNAQIESANAAYVDKFEMADGTRYKLEYDTDNARRWDDRDPRFRENIITDRYQWGSASQTVFNLWHTPAAGTDKIASTPTSYLIKKYWPFGANNYDRVYTDVVYRMPHMRLADVYLIYAEAVNEAYGSDGSVPGASLTAVDAINIIRQRAGMPATSVALATAAGYDSFRDLIRNERNVELCFEGHYFYDNRRWYIAHLPENKAIVDFRFDKNWTSFERVTVLTRVFDDPKHYWMGLPVSQTQIYNDFYQNPGW